MMLIVKEVGELKMPSLAPINNNRIWRGATENTTYMKCDETRRLFI